MPILSASITKSATAAVFKNDRVSDTQLLRCAGRKKT
jgi:hypothetical protein